MAGRLLPRLFDVVVNANGGPVAGALMTTYVNNTTTLKTTWTTAALSTPHTNPIVADSAGRFPDIWGVEGETYRVKLTDASGVLIYQSDDIITLGANPDGVIDRDFGADGRFQIYSSGGVSNFEGGDPSPDNTGGKVRIGGWNDTQADTAEIDAAATTITGTAAIAGNATIGGTATVTGNTTLSGTLAVSGATTFGGSVTLSDGSTLTSSNKTVIVSGRYYWPDTILWNTNPGGGSGNTKDIIYWLPLTSPLTIDALVLECASTAVGATALLGVYSSDSTTGLPKTRLATTSSVSMAAAGVKVATLSVSVAVTARVWLAYVLSDNAASARTNPNATGCDVRVLGFAGFTANDSVLALYSTYAYAALPSTAPAITGAINGNLPLIGVRAV